jgi:hypothetical protein
MRNGSLEKQLDNLRDDFGSLLNVAGKLLAGKATDAKDVVVDRGGDAMSAFVKIIKRQPLAAIGIAFGLGFVAMRLVRR